MKKKLFLTLCLVFVLAIGFNTVAYASEDTITIEDYNVSVDDNGYFYSKNGTLMNVDDLLKFDSVEDAEISLFKNVESNNATIEPFETRSKQCVDTADYIAGNIKLWVSYTTSGDNHTGKITRHNAYTQLTGFSMGIDWKEDLVISEITSSGKDVYAECQGTADIYLLVNNQIKLVSDNIELSGYAFVIH